MNARSHFAESMNPSDLVEEQLFKAKSMVALMLVLPDLNTFHKDTLFDYVWALDEHVGIALETFHRALARFDRYATHSIPSLKSRGFLGHHLYKAQRCLAELLTTDDPEQLNANTLQGYFLAVEKHVIIALENTNGALMTVMPEGLPRNDAVYTQSTVSVPVERQKESAGSKKDP